MKKILAAAFASAILTGAAHAQMTDMNMTCEQYTMAAAEMMKMPEMKAAAEQMDKATKEMDAKLNAYCKANPKAKLMEATEKAMMMK